MFESARASLNLSDEQKAKMKDAAQAGREAREKVIAILTPEQQEIVKKAMEAHRGEGKGARRKSESEGSK